MDAKLEHRHWNYAQSPLSKFLRLNTSPYILMEDIEERAEMQLRAIEMAYSIKIQNKETISRFIAARIKDKIQVLIICTSINSWIASNDIIGEVVVPMSVVSTFVDAI